MQYVDLSLVIGQATPSFPGEPGGYFIPFASHALQKWSQHQLLLYTHLGTHVDAPSHFLPEGSSVLTMSLQQLIGPAMIVGARKTLLGGEELQYEDFIWPREPMPGDRILLQTNWDKTWQTDAYFAKYPRLGVDLIKKLVMHDIALLGMDTPTPHDDQNELIHHLLLDQQIVILEGLAQLATVPVSAGQLICLPLPLQGMDGSPARVVFGYET